MLVTLQSSPTTVGRVGAALCVAFVASLAYSAYQNGVRPSEAEIAWLAVGALLTASAVCRIPRAAALAGIFAVAGWLYYGRTGDPVLAGIVGVGAPVLFTLSLSHPWILDNLARLLPNARVVEREVRQ